MTEMRLDSIVIGDRVRKDMGDLISLAASMKAHGLLHPVVVKKDKTLVAGHRRLEAAKSLGWNEIPVTVVDVEDLLAAERDENTERKDFTPTEAVAIGRLIEEQVRPKIEAQRRKNISASRDGEKVTPSPKTRNIVGDAIGMSGPIYERAKAVVVAAEDDPENFGDLPAKMDETGNVTGTHNEMKLRKNGQKPRHAALRKLQYPKPNREMQRAVDALDGICICLKELPIKQLDASKTKSWAVALKKAASVIFRIAREVERVKAN